jgi:hypothetical protein
VRRKKLRVNVYAYPIIALVVFLGIIQLSTLTPYWNTASRSVGGPETGEMSTTSGAAQLVDTAEIKGSWTLGDAATTFQVPASEIIAHYGVPAEVPETTALKDLGKYSPGFETELLRVWLKGRSPVAKK